MVSNFIYFLYTVFPFLSIYKLSVYGTYLFNFIFLFFSVFVVLIGMGKLYAELWLIQRVREGSDVEEV